MLKNLRLFILFSVLLTAGYSAFGQTPPTFNVDISGSTDTSVTIANQKRDGNWCADNNCIVFNITVNPNSDLINFNASQITGASFYSINCGPQIPIGTPACISGLTTVQISFCKPGNNPVDYYITATRTVKASADLNLRQLCSGTMSVTGLQAASVVWTSVFPGAQGAYNSYLSPATGSLTTTVTPQIGAPAYIDYKVSGNQNTVCTGPKSDTVRVYTSPPLTVAISPANPTICSGASVTLTATPGGGLPGYTYSWNTGATTPSITVSSPGTYTVSVMDQLSGCPAAVQQVVVGTSSPPAAPTASGTTVCPGATATLTASAPGGTYSWYAVSSGGTALGTGPSFTTPPLTSTTTYYVETLIGCVSPRTPVTASVATPPPAPTVTGTTICSGSTATLVATAPGGTYQWYDAPSGGNLLGTGVSYTTPALTNNTTYYVQTTVNGCTGARTAALVTVTPPPAAPTASGATICADNNTTLTATGPGGNYQWFDAATGGNLLQTGASYITPVLNANTTYYVQTTLNGCLSSRTAVTVTIIPIINPEFEYASGTYCKSGPGVTDAPTVYTPGGGTFSGSAGLVFANAGTGEIDVLNTPLGTYTVTFTNSSTCPRASTALVTITNAPDATFSYASTTLCLGSANVKPVFPALSSAGVFSSSDPGLVFISESTGEIDLNASLAGTYIITNNIAAGGGCAAAAANFTITIAPSPPAPTITGIRTICEGSSTTLTANSSGATSYEWFSVPSGGSALQSSTSPSYATAVLNSTTTFYVQAIQNGCPGPRIPVTVNVTPSPATPSASGITVCAGSSATLTAVSPGGIYSWYDVASGGVSLATGNTFTTAALTTTTTFYVETFLNGCTSSRRAVVVTVTPLPGAPTVTGANICVGNPATLTVTQVVGTFDWYDAAVGGNLVMTGSTFTTPSLTANRNYYVQATVGGCVGPRTLVAVTVSQKPAAPIASGTTICPGTPATLIASGSGGIYEWYDTSFGGVLVHSGSAFTTPALTTVTRYYVQEVVNGCPGPRTEVIVNINSVPTAPTVVAPAICVGNSTTLSATGPGGNYQWYDAASDGNLLQTGSTYTTPVLNATTTFYVQTTINGCTSSRTAVSVSTIPIINPEFEYPTGTYCKSGPAITPPPIIHTPGGGTFSATPGLVFANSTTGEIDIAATPLGTYTITFTNNSQCPRSSTANVTITNFPVATFSYGSGTFCTGAGNTAAIFPPGASAGVFSASPGGLVFISASTGEINLTASSPGTYQITNNITASGGCAAASHNVSITISASPTAPTASGATICAGNSTALIASAPGGAYEWFDAAIGGTLLGTSAAFTTPVLKITTTYYVQTTINGCTGPRTAVKVQVTPVIDPEFEYSSGTYCKSGIAVTPPPGIYTVGGGTFNSTAGLVFVSKTTGEIDVLASTIGTYTVSFTNNSPCPRVTYAKVTITNFPDATFSYSGPYCPGSTNPLPNFQAGASAGLFKSSSPALVFVSSTTGEIDLEMSSPGTYIVTNTIAANGGCVTATHTSTVTINPTPVVPSAKDISVCKGSTAVLAVSDLTGTYQWFDRAIGGTMLGTGSSFTTTAINSTTRFYVQAITNTCASARKEIIVTVNAIPVPPVVVSNSPVCTGNTIVLGATYVPGATYTWEGPNNFTSSLQNPGINLANSTNAGKYTVFITVNGCVSAVSETEVRINEVPVTIAGPDQTLCVSTNAINLKGSVTGLSTTGIWSSNGTGTFSPSNTSLNAVYIPSPLDKASLKVLLTLTSLNNQSCAPVTSTLSVNFLPLPVVNAGNDLSVCGGDVQVNLSGSISGASGGIWNTDGDGRFSPANTSLNAIYIPGIKDKEIGWVTLTLSSIGNGLCSAVSDQMVVTINPLPNVYAGKDKVIRLDESIILKDASSDPGVEYLWAPAAGLSDNKIKEPVFSGTISQLYTLTVTNKSGCSSTDEVFVKVLQPIIIPNTFTPNGDGANDLWNIDQLKNYSESTVNVYNRYGVKLFYSQGYDQPWDGTYQGVQVPAGTYYYVIDTKMGEVFSGYILIVK
ncbi:MAG: gliding motility-associated C-terminal domain-containing protein [Bacteroidota bacterium]